MNRSENHLNELYEEFTNDQIKTKRQVGIFYKGIPIHPSPAKVYAGEGIARQKLREKICWYEYGIYDRSSRIPASEKAKIMEKIDAELEELINKNLLVFRPI